MYQPHDEYRRNYIRGELKMTIRVIAAALLLAPLGACAELQFSDTPKDGFVPFVVQRTYFIVNSDAACQQHGRVVVMNDLEKTYYVRPRGGYGSYNLTAKFNQGVMTEFGNQNDTTKLPDAISTVAGLAGLGAERSSSTSTSSATNLVTPFALKGAVPEAKTCTPHVAVYAMGLPGRDGKTFHLVDIPPELVSIDVTSPKPDQPADSGDKPGS